MRPPYEAATGFQEANGSRGWRDSERGSCDQTGWMFSAPLRQEAVFLPRVPSGPREVARRPHRCQGWGGGTGEAGKGLEARLVLPGVAWKPEPVLTSPC